MFDAVQEEILYQYALLPEDSRRAEASFVKLSTFQIIAHRHLVNLRSGGSESRNLGREGWLPSLRELDDGGISLDRELEGKAREVLTALRRKGSRIETWEECYDHKSGITLEDGKRYTLRREATREIHKAAKKAIYHLAKIWSPKRIR
jgi:hypothetical protein